MRYAIAAALIIAVLVVVSVSGSRGEGVALRARVEGYMLQAWFEDGGVVVDPELWGEHPEVYVELSNGQVMPLRCFDGTFKVVLPYRTRATILRIVAHTTQSGEPVQLTGKLEKRLYLAR